MIASDLSLAALRQRFPELQGMGDADVAGYLSRKFRSGEFSPSQFASTGGVDPAAIARAAPQQPAQRRASPAQPQSQAAATPTVSLAQFREQYPQYHALGDAELADRLYRRYYADKIPRADYDARLGLTAQPAASVTASQESATGPWSKYTAKPAASYEQIMTALRNAHNAGDTAAATRLAAMAKEAKGEGGNKFVITAPDGKKYKVTGDSAEGAVAALKKMLGGAEPQSDRSTAMAERAAAAKAGTLVASPEALARAAGADVMASEAMQGGTSQSVMPNARRIAEAVQTLEGLERSGRITPEEQTALDRHRAKTTPGTVGGLAGAATDGALFGFGDEYLGTMSAILGVQPDGQGGANWFDYSKPYGERYSTARDAIRQEQGQFREAAPVASFGGEVMGSLLFPAGAGASVINAGKGTAARVGRGLLAGGASGAAYGFGEGEGGIEARAMDGLLAAPVGAIGGGALVAAGQGINKAITAVTKRAELREAIPTLEGLRETAKGLYDKARDMGGALSGEQIATMTKGISTQIKEAGFDRQLHPRVAAVVDRLTIETGPKSLQEMEILRRVASNAAASLQPDERRIAMQVVDAIDDAVDGMGGGSAALSAARDTWARLRRMEIVDTAMEKAALTDDFAAGLRNQFKILLRSPRALRGFTEAQREAIRTVATGTATTRALRGLGKLMSPTGISGAALTGGAAFAGAGIGSLAIPVAGAGMSKAAGLLAQGAAKRAKTMAGMTEAQRGILAALMQRSNPAAKAAYAPGLLGSYLTGGEQ